MFIGAINQDLRAIVNELAVNWTGLPVYVGCSGNFTVERILSKAGISEIHGNDVSMYTCVIGGYLSGNPVSVIARDEQYDWLNKYMDTPLDKIATLLLCGELFKFTDRDEPYHKRMVKAYINRFDSMHAGTVENVKKALDGVKLSSFFAGDVIDYLSNAPNDIVAIGFPPTYRAGYERLYKKIDEVFEWEKPDYIYLMMNGSSCLPKS